MRDNELLTVKEVATFLRVSRVTVWRWCQRGLIPASKVGRNWRIRRDDLLELLEIPVCLPSNNSDQQDSSAPNNNSGVQKIMTASPKSEKNT